MEMNASLVHSHPMSRKFTIGVTIAKKGELVCVDNTGGEVGNPTSVNDYTEAVGTTNEAVTHVTTKGTDTDATVEVFCDPSGIIKAKASGGTAVNTALAEATDGNLLTNTSADTNGKTVTDADVGTSEFVGGRIYATSGDNKGLYRTCTSHTDNTSTAVEKAFDATLAANDTFLRTFGRFNQGMELTTDFTQINMKLGAAVDIPDTGHGLCWDIEVDLSGSVPVVWVLFLMVDPAYRSIA